MDISPFFIEFMYNDDWILAEVKPCCQEENVFYYDIIMNNQFQFTITPGHTDDDNTDWRIALKNADKDVDPELVKNMGEHIERHYAN